MSWNGECYVWFTYSKCPLHDFHIHTDALTGWLSQIFRTNKEFSLALFLLWGKNKRRFRTLSGGSNPVRPLTKWYNRHSDLIICIGRCCREQRCFFSTCYTFKYEHIEHNGTATTLRRKRVKWSESAWISVVPAGHTARERNCAALNVEWNFGTQTTGPGER